MDTFSKKWLYWLLKPLSMLPLPVLFVISDVFIFPLIYWVARYRLNVVRSNLASCFPEKTAKELKRLEMRFYRHFCDSFMEMIRVLSMPDDEGRRRMKCINTEVFTRNGPQGKGSLVVLGHYGNWEYQVFLQLYMPDGWNQEPLSVYRPLKNKAFDYLYQRIRTHFGGKIVTKDGTYRKIIQLRRDNIPGVFGMVSDQSPSQKNINYWTNFLNHDTAIYSGPDRMARQTGYAVVYADVRKLSRGHYQTEYSILSDDPQSEAPDAITERYARAMEQTILRDPAFWLWTHKRWKHKRNND